jgi:hypothetical protein
MNAFRPHPAHAIITEAESLWSSDPKQAAARARVIVEALVKSGIITGGEWFADGAIYGTGTSPSTETVKVKVEGDFNVGRDIRKALQQRGAHMTDHRFEP